MIVWLTNTNEVIVVVVREVKMDVDTVTDVVGTVMIDVDVDTDVEVVVDVVNDVLVDVENWYLFRNRLSLKLSPSFR